MVRRPEAEPGGRDPVAIVGAACRLPGAPDVEAFWDLLVEERRTTDPEGLRGHGSDEGLDLRVGLLIGTLSDALTDAGLGTDRLTDGRVGVYAAVTPPLSAAYGRALAARISRRLRLRGPSVDLTEPGTTSLLGVHLACRALWAGEIDLAVVAAVNLPSPPGEDGVVAVVLERLAQARDAGDGVYAAISGTAASNVRTDGISMPSLQATMHAAYRDAGVSPGELDYVETQGGAAELPALDRLLRSGLRCLVGSAMPNVGDTGVAAGLVGLLKTALALRHRRIPATLETDAGAFSARATTPWPGDGPGLAGVGSYGQSGVGVHVVLTGPPRPAIVGRERPEAYLLPLSARDPEALHALTGAYADALDHPAADPLDACFTAGTRYAHHEHRMAVVGTGTAELAAALRSPAESRRLGVAPRVVFVFPGQGAHWDGMARGLLRSSPVFARRIRECARAVEAELGWSPLDRLRGDGRLSAVDEVQPTVWAVQVALAEVWRGWGIQPDLVIGHSMGEMAAATVAGALTVADAAAVVCRRGLLLVEHAVPGAMWAVQLGEREAQEAIGEYADQVCAGVLNSATSTVLSGDPAVLAKVTEPLLERGIFCRRVKVGYASHAPQVEPMRADLLAALAGVRPRAAQIPMHSTAWDRRVDGTELDAAYWMANLRSPVRFGAAVRSVLDDGEPTVFIEVSSHPLLVKPIEESIEACDAAAIAVGSLVRKRPDLESLLTALGTVFTAGCDPDWSRLHTGGRLVSLSEQPGGRPVPTV